jgi:hypothetical protein
MAQAAEIPNSRMAAPRQVNGACVVIRLGTVALAFLFVRIPWFLQG